MATLRIFPVCVKYLSFCIFDPPKAEFLLNIEGQGQSQQRLLLNPAVAAAVLLPSESQSFITKCTTIQILESIQKI